MEKRKRHLTTNQGVPVTDNQNSLTVGERGPVLLQDVQFIEKMAHFDRERIPERVVHAKGAGAHGYFQVYKSMKPYTKAKFLQDPAEKDPRIRAVFHRHWRSRLCGYGQRPPRLCRQVLYRGWQLRPGGEQSPRVFHSGRHQVPGHGSRFQRVTRYQHAISLLGT